jgi:hypothetical protein
MGRAELGAHIEPGMGEHGLDVGGDRLGGWVELARKLGIAADELGTRDAGRGGWKGEEEGCWRR